MDFEEILTKVGNFGRYQKFRVTLLSLVTFPVVLQTYIQVFTAGKGDYWCRSWTTEKCENLNITTAMDCEVLKKKLSIPASTEMSSDSIVYMQCLRYNVSGMDLETAVFIDPQHITSLEKIPCDEGWIFDKTTFPSSVVYDLVCGKSFLTNIAQSGYFAGSLLGSLATGIASDTFGRRKAILLNLASASVVGVAISFSPNFIIYMVLRFFTAMSVQGVCQVCYALGNELVTPSKRVVVMSILLVSAGCSYVVLAGMAKFIPNWQMLHLMVSTPNIVLLILIYFLIPESPRWLLANNRHSDAENVMRKIANGNGKTLSQDFTTANVNKAAEVKGNMKDAIRSRVGIFLAISVSFIWMVASLTFYGLTLNTSSFGIDPYLSLCLFGVIEVPAYLSAMFLTETFGRRNVVFTSFVLGGICCCVVPLIASPLWRMLLAVAGKFFISITFGAVNLWTIEMVPTSMRSRFMGLFSVSSRVGGIIAPMLLILQEIWPSLPILVFGLLSFAAGFLCLLLPETMGMPLPVTMKNTKELYRIRKPSKAQKRAPRTDEKETGYCNRGMQEDETMHNS